MGKMSQRKGKAAERELCHLIEAATGQKCYRVPMSGAAAEFSKMDLYGPCFDRKNGILAGDGFESKNAQRASLWAWWEQTETHARQEDKHPRLAMRKEGGGWIVAMPLEDYLAIRKQAAALEAEALACDERTNTIAAQAERKGFAVTNAVSRSIDSETRRIKE